MRMDPAQDSRETDLNSLLVLQAVAILSFYILSSNCVCMGVEEVGKVWQGCICKGLQLWKGFVFQGNKLEPTIKNSRKIWRFINASSVDFSILQDESISNFRGFWNSFTFTVFCIEIPVSKQCRP